MSIIFVGDVLPSDVFKSISNVPPSANNIEIEVLRKLHSAYGDNLYVISKNFALKGEGHNERIISEQTYVIDGKIKINTIRFCNNKFLKNISGIYYLFKKIRGLTKEIKSKQTDERNIFVVYNPFYQQALPVFLAKAHKDVVISIMAEGLDIRFLKEKKIRLYDNAAHLINKYLFRKNRGIITYCAATVKRYASKVEYISLLHASDTKLFEGIKKETIKEGKITLLYAGMLTSCYGIDAILNTMKKLPDNYNMVICGSGSDERINHVKEAEKADDRIHYMGLIPREEVIKLEISADALLIIRVAESEVDKYINTYCQPSKISEYLMSGTPVIATRIPSIPNEFDEYLNYTTENPDEMAETILSVTGKDNNSYKIKAENGKAFTKINGTYEKQFSKLLEFVQKIEFDIHGQKS